MNEATTAVLSSLYDASIDALSVFEDAVSIQLDDVIIDGRSSRVSVKLLQVRIIRREGEMVSDLSMEQSDGELVFFEPTRSGVKLLIQWNCFRSQKTKDIFYEIECSEIIAQSTFD